MDQAPRYSTTEPKQRPADLASKPVLARLPDVATDVEPRRSVSKSAGNLGYRFDPPQVTESGRRNSNPLHSQKSATLKSELIYAPRPTRPNQPHMLDRARAATHTERTARTVRESPILPRSNLFDIPPRGLMDSFSPLLRFATLFVLCTAAFTWLQMIGYRFPLNSGNQPIDAPATTAQEPAQPNTKTAERPGKGPTATGPKRSTPESNTRVGRSRDNDDYAHLRGDILPDPAAAGDLNATTPELLGPSGVALPKVQTAEAATATGSAESAAPAASAEIARLPSVIDATPTR